MHDEATVHPYLGYKLYGSRWMVQSTSSARMGLSLLAGGPHEFGRQAVDDAEAVKRFLDYRGINEQDAMYMHLSSSLAVRAAAREWASQNLK